MAWRLWAAVLAVACLFSAGDVSAARKAKAPVDDSPVFKANPDVVTGVLPNGLRYAVMHSDSPKAGLSLRLTIDAGLYDEEADQRGAAHFVEHMAFSSNRAKGEDDPIKAFEAAGVTFGRDQNAFTTLFNTSYLLDLKEADGPLADLSFQWLRAVADGTTFPEADVTRERGVLLAERGARATPSYESTQSLLDFMIPGLRVRDRMRLDAAESLGRLDGPRLKAFYERWYRPERAVVVVVGDLPVEALKKRVEETFSGWQGKGPAPTRVPFAGPQTARPLTVSTRATPHAVSQVNVCRATPSALGPMTNVASIRRRVLSQAWVSSLLIKLYMRTAEPEPPYAFVNANILDLQEVRLICVSAVPTNEQWEPALAAIQQSLEEMDTDKVTEELAMIAPGGSVAGVLANTIVGEGDAAGTATSIAASLMAGDTVMTVAEGARVGDLATKDVKAADMRRAFTEDWRGDGPMIAVYAPQPPTPDAVKAAWVAGVGKVADPVPAPKPAIAATPLKAGTVKSGTWPYFDFGKPGRVVSREHVAAGDFNRYTFQNGVILNIKSKDLDASQVMVGVRFGAGRMEVASKDYLTALLGSQMLGFGGLGKVDFEALSSTLGASLWGANLSLQPDRFVLSGATTAGDLRRELQVLAAYMTDPAFRPYGDQRVKTMIDTVYRMLDSTPAAAMTAGLERALAPKGPWTFPPREEAVNIDSAAFERVLKPVLTSAPVEVNIAGNVNEGWAVRWVGETFGALPARSAAPRAAPDAWVRRFPEHPGPVLRVDTPDAQGGLVAAIWPLWQANVAQRKEEIAVRILVPILDQAVRDRIRWKLGRAYGDDVVLSLDDGPDQGYLMAAVSVSAGEADLVAAEMPKTVEALVRGEIDPAAFERSKKAVLEEAGSLLDIKSPAVWLAILENSSRVPDTYADIKSRSDLIKSITLDDVKRAAARWLAPAPMLVIAEPPQAGKVAANDAFPWRHQPRSTMSGWRKFAEERRWNLACGAAGR